MHSSWLLVVCCLVQQGAEVPVGNGDTAAPPAIQNNQAPPAASAFIAAALRVPADAGLKGRPVTLIEVLAATTGDPQQQLAATMAYWQLAEAVAAYHYAWDRQQRLEQLAAMLPASATGQPEQVELSARRSAAAAAMAEARLDLIDAQYRVLPYSPAPAEVLPLPADVPHVGTYNTYFERIFATQTPPLRARVIHETLPLKREAISTRADALQSAYDALAASIDGWRAGTVSMRAVFSCLDDLSRQRAAFLASVRFYNDDIAEYALPVARPTMTAENIAGMLIRRPMTGSNGTAGGWNAASSDGVVQAGFDEPIVDEPTPAAGEPTKANKPADVDQGQPSAADQGAVGESGNGELLAPLVAVARRMPDEAVVYDGAVAVTAGTANRVDDTGLYPALVEMPAESRAGRLVELLHWDRELPNAAGTPLAMRDLLAAARGEARPSAIQLYWQAREAAARYQAIVQHDDQLAAMGQAVLERRSQAGATEAMLQVQTWRLGAKAARIEAEAVLLDAQRQLQYAVGQAAQAEPLLPSTPPYAGGFDANAAAQAGANTSQRALIASLPRAHESLAAEADAVVRADRFRADATNRYLAGAATADEVLEAIGRQTDQTLDLLATVTRYNSRLADYALATLPASATDEMLLSALRLSGAE